MMAIFGTCKRLTARILLTGVELKQQSTGPHPCASRVKGNLPHLALRRRRCKRWRRRRRRRRRERGENHRVSSARLQIARGCRGHKMPRSRGCKQINITVVASNHDEAERVARWPPSSRSTFPARRSFGLGCLPVALAQLPWRNVIERAKANARLLSCAGGAPRRACLNVLRRAVDRKLQTVNELI